MLTLAATRFSDCTWEQNRAYRRKHNIQGCVYGSPRTIALAVLPQTPVFVVEMNNTQRRVEGIGMVLNAPSPSRAWIYDEGRYNFYTYRSNFRLDRTELEAAHIPGHPAVKLLWFLEQIVFAKAVLPNGPSTLGLRLIMRGHGISRLPKWLYTWKPEIRVRRKTLVVRHNNYDLRELIHSEFEKKYPGAPELGLSPSQMETAVQQNAGLSDDRGASSDDAQRSRDDAVQRSCDDAVQRSCDDAVQRSCDDAVHEACDRRQLEVPER